MEKSIHNKSQNDQIIDYLQTHNCITSLDAVHEFGCMRLAARIADLEKRGVRFIHQPVIVENRYGQKCKVMSYALADCEAVYE